MRCVLPSACRINEDSDANGMRCGGETMPPCGRCHCLIDAAGTNYTKSAQDQCVKEYMACAALT